MDEEFDALRKEVIKLTAIVQQLFNAQAEINQEHARCINAIINSLSGVNKND